MGMIIMKKNRISTLAFFTLFFTLMVANAWAKESLAIFGPRYKKVKPELAGKIFTAFEEGVARSGVFRVMRTDVAMDIWKKADTEFDVKCRNPLCLVVIAQELRVEKLLLPYIKVEENKLLFGYRCFEQVSGQFSYEKTFLLQEQNWQSGLNDFVKKTVAEIPRVGKIKLVKENDIALNVGNFQGVNAGGKFEVFRFKDVMVGKRYLFKDETKVGDIKIVKVENNTSTAKITNVSKDFKIGDVILVKGTRKVAGVTGKPSSPKPPDKKKKALVIYDAQSKRMITAKEARDQFSIKVSTTSGKKAAPPKTTPKPVVKTAAKPVVKKETKPVVKTAAKPVLKKEAKPVVKKVVKPVEKKVVATKKKEKKKAAKPKKSIKHKLVKLKRGKDWPPGMVLVPAGDFLMGSSDGDLDEKPRREVFLDAFYIDEHEVTNADYKKFLKATKRRAPDYLDDPDLGKPDRPVVGVSFEDAAAYAEWVGKRLPTEAEWEKASRGTDGWIYPWGNEFDIKKANKSGEKDGYPYTAGVGKFLLGISPYGALNMSGNVWEWCADFYQENYYAVAPKENPKGPKKGVARVIRGGSWDNGSSQLRSSNRSAADIEAGRYDLGFRCAINRYSYKTE